MAGKQRVDDEQSRDSPVKSQPPFPRNARDHKVNATARQLSVFSRSLSVKELITDNYR